MRLSFPVSYFDFFEYLLNKRKKGGFPLFLTEKKIKKDLIEASFASIRGTIDSGGVLDSYEG